MKSWDAILMIPGMLTGVVKYILSWLVPKDKNLWVFGSWFGENYSDNSKYLFEYVLKEKSSINAIWITNNRDVFIHLKAQGKPVYLSKNWQGKWAICRAKVVIMSCSKRDIDEYLITNRSINVQLWHGVGYKKILYDTKQRQYSLLMKIIRFLLPFARNELNFDLLVSTSKLMQSRFSSAFRLPKSKIPILGYPRNDIFFEEKNLLPSKRFSILYAPTHRGGGSGKTSSLIPNSRELERLSMVLIKMNAHLTFKFHFYDYYLIPNESYDGITFLRATSTDDVQEILLHTDLLIVDYSSIYFDYLLLDRPILFAPFDLKDYKNNDQDIYEDYEDIAPGYIAVSWFEVMQRIEQIILEPDSHKEKRRELRERYWEYNDGESSRKVFDEIKKRLDI